MTEPKQTGGKGKIKPRWVKGQSGNPKGKPKKNPAMKEMAEILPDLPELFAKVLTEKKGDMTAIEAGIRRTLSSWINSGNLQAGRLILEWAYGLPKQKIDLKADVNNIVPPPIQINLSQDIVDAVVIEAQTARSDE